MCVSASVRSSLLVSCSRAMVEKGCRVLLPHKSFTNLLYECDHGPPNVQVLNLLVKRNMHKQCHYYLYFCMLNETYFVFQDRSERHTGEYWGILPILQPWTLSGVNLVYLINLVVQHFFFFYFYLSYVIFLQYFSVQPGGRRPFRLTSGDNVNVAPWSLRNILPTSCRR